jgi:hypothetical protein
LEQVKVKDEETSLKEQLESTPQLPLNAGMPVEPVQDNSEQICTD